VVQVNQHGPAARRRSEQITELAEDMRTDERIFKMTHHGNDRLLARIHIEMIEPKIHHHLFQRAFRINSPQQLCPLQLAKCLSQHKSVFVLSGLDRISCGLHVSRRHQSGFMALRPCRLRLLTAPHFRLKSTHQICGTPRRHKCRNRAKKSPSEKDFSFSEG
jgi:hypothetical protein